MQTCLQIDLMVLLLFVIIHLLTGLTPHHLPTAAGVVYYVLPTEPCSHNGSCPSGKTCHTMDYYASNSSHYFSPLHDHRINVTLYFICGVHNCAKHLDVHDLDKFAMIGTAGRLNVTINMPLPTKLSPNPQDKGKRTYTFMNVSNVRIENITINYISVSFEGKYCKFIAQNVDFHGYISSTSPLLSIINITGSQALLDNCTFQHNSFIALRSSAELTINDCTFHSYNHVMYSAIGGINSTLILSGTVYFINNTVGSPSRDGPTCGGVIFLMPNIFNSVFPQSILNISRQSCVYFINNTADYGGALCLNHTAMNVGIKVTMTFHGNKARDKNYGYVGNTGYGGAILLRTSSITHSNTCFSDGAIHALSHSNYIALNKNSILHFIDNTATFGGAISMHWSSNMEINCNASIHFTNNIAHTHGGAIFIDDTSHFPIRNGLLYFVNNYAGSGGAIYMTRSSISISEHSEVNFINNSATLKGGAVYQSITGSISIDMHSCLMFNNNSAGKGGALYLTSSDSIIVGSDSVITFFSNSASEVGGAICADVQVDLPCFLVLKDYSSALDFQGNSAISGAGMHIYGASIRGVECTPSPSLEINKNYKYYCGSISKINISLVPDLNNNLSPVSSDSKRVCLCDLNGHPQCASLSNIFVNKSGVYSGESFNLSVVVVGHDFGVTTGTIHAIFISSKGYRTPKLNRDQYHQWIKSSKQCSNITYTVHSSKQYEIFYLQTTTSVNNYYSYGEGVIKFLISRYNMNQHGCLDQKLLTTSVFINVSFLPGCPPGFTRRDQTYGCNCYAILKTNQFSCFLINNTGYLKWNSTIWVAAAYNKNSNKTESDDILTMCYSQHCPLDYCTSGEKTIDIGTDPDAQCAFNHAGVLCGGCKVNYSLAIGSSHCLSCSNDSYQALLIFFAAAGFLLVIFILALNLTVTQGLINGLIFYANIVWAYKGILFPSEQQHIMLYFQVFIAWLNLDFGIESCFAVGLNAFGKTLLQFIFPLYIWVIAGVIIMACRFSSLLANLVGDRAVPLLATLFLLSYMKLLRTAVAGLVFGVITQYPDESKSIVWYLDGNLLHCQHPHIYLFIVSLVTLILCLPFTFFLLLIRWWMKISHWRLLRWINKYTPIYDAYLAPLKDKHQYWFGISLLMRGLLLISFTLTTATSPNINLLVLLITMPILLFYTSIKPVYKCKIVRILESASILNLVALSGSTLYAGSKWTVILEISIGFAFVQFCVIIIISLIKIYNCYTRSKCTQRNSYNVIDQDSAEEIFHERVEDMKS